MREKIRVRESVFFLCPRQLFSLSGLVGEETRYQICVCYSSKTFMQIMFVLPWVSRRIFHQDGCWLFRPRRFRLCCDFFPPLVVLIWKPKFFSPACPLATVCGRTCLDFLIFTSSSPTLTSTLMPVHTPSPSLHHQPSYICGVLYTVPSPPTPAARGNNAQ